METASIKAINIFLLSLLTFTCLQAHTDNDTSAKATSVNTQKNITTSIAAIDIDIFDRVTGEIVGGEGPSDPYGLFNDIFVKVKIKSSANSEAELTVKLTATTPQTEDEARGTVQATKQVFSKTALLSNDSNTTSIPFLVEFTCSPMTFTVELVELKLKKSVSKNFACAE